MHLGWLSTTLIYLAIVTNKLECKQNPATCEPLEVAMCQEFYNSTQMPSSRTATQHDARLIVQQYNPLIKIGCSDVLEKFLCLSFLPECTKSGELIYPCRSMCESVRKDCIGILNTYNFDWPVNIDCSTFSENKCEKIDSTVPSTVPATCEPLEIKMCQGFYNSTQMPSLRATTQDAAGLTISMYQPLVMIECSDMLQQFLCMSYLPECTELEEIIYPCRSTCRSVKKGCIGIMKSFGMIWPDSLKCSTFPKEKCKTIESTVSTTVPAFCEPLEVEVCQDYYNSTQMPSSRTSTQDDAGLIISGFYPLIKIQCSEYLQQFLCLSFLPECTESEEILYPCRSMCERVKNDCIGIMEKFAFSWPDSIQCSTYPEQKCKGIDSPVPPSPGYLYYRLKIFQIVSQVVSILQNDTANDTNLLSAGATGGN